MPIKLNLLAPMQISDLFHSPALASLMERRHESLFLSGVVAVQFGLVTAGLPGWPCPFKAAFGLPCPGCGISTSISYLLHGDWHAALTTHAFAPIFFIGMLFVAVVSLLPEATRVAIVQKVAAIEKRTGITIFLMLSLMFYWGFRLLRL